MKDQFDKLISQPPSKVRGMPTLVIVIDALNECEREERYIYASMLWSRAIPLLIFAATACRSIGDLNWDSEDQLRIVLTFQTSSQADKLDQTYLPILDRLVRGLPDSEKQSLIRGFRTVVSSIVLFANPLSTASLASLLGISERVIDRRRGSLHSVLGIPADRNTPRPITASLVPRVPY